MARTQPALPADSRATRLDRSLPIHRLWIASELYFPEETSTGYVMTTLAEALARYYDVRVLCGQPTYSARGTLAPAREIRNGVDITRCAGLKLDKDVIWRRAANMVTLSMSIFFRALLSLRSGDVAIVVTNPPALPFLVTAAARLRRAHAVLLIHDVYPEAMIASGLLQRDGLAARIWSRATSALYQRVSRICVIGRDMARLVASKHPGLDQRISFIPNWSADEVLAGAPNAGDEMRRELGLEDKFVVQYAGNMGKVHDIECLIQAARLIKDIAPNVHWVFIGSGVKRAWLVERVRVEGLSNVTVLPPKPRSEEFAFLRACDISVMALVPGMSGVGVPSRLYNIMAAGRPVIALADPASEPARVIAEEGIGWTVETGDVTGLVEVIRTALNDREHMARMSVRATAAARDRYSLHRIVNAYRALIEDVRIGRVS